MTLTEGRMAIITGGAPGIGRATSRMLTGTVPEVTGGRFV